MNNNNSRKNRRKTRKSSRQNQGRDGLPSYQQGQTLTLTRSIGTGSIFPDRYITTLRYNKMFYHDHSTTSGQAYALTYFTPSNAYDVDPVLGNAALVGFNTLGALYDRFRVLKSSIKIQGVNNVTNNTFTMGLAPKNVAPQGSSVEYIMQLINQPYGKGKLAASQGGGVTTLTHSMSTEKILGSKAALYDDSYQGTYNGGPINNWFWVFGTYVIATQADMFPKFFMELSVDVEFYELKTLT